MRTPFVALLTAAVAAGGAPVVEAQSKGDSTQRPSRTVKVIPGAHYTASGLHRFFFGNHYRDLWATPVTVRVLDLETYAGGLRPTRRGGGKQTKSLRFASADGRKFAFRSLDKDPAPVLPPDLRATLVSDIFQDQISASHPMGALVVPPLLEAAGLPRAVPELYLMPDDPALGKFRAEFANMLGLLEERPTERDDDSPGFAGARKVVDTDELFARMQEDPREQIDTRAFLTARLMDLLVGDWDRHAKQWKWIKVDEGKRAPWVPVPYDRDQAFVKYDGFLLMLGRQNYPQLVNFSATYPSMLGLTWNGRELDRRLLTGLEWPVWDSTARALAGRLTDSVIDVAVHQLPPEDYAKNGARLTHALRARRDALPTAARDFYRLLAGQVDVHATDANETVTAERAGDGTLDLTLARRKKDGSLDDPYYHRRFVSGETKEVRLYLGGGDDSVRVRGQGGPLLRVVGTPATVVDRDDASGVAIYRDRVPYQPPDSARLVRPGAHEPPESTSVVERAPRDWGQLWRFNPVVRYSPDLGLVFGVAPSLTTFGFRQHPYASKLRLRGGYATSQSDFRVDFLGDFRRPQSTTHLLLESYYSGIEILRFFGFGNNTPRVLTDDQYKVHQRQFLLGPTVAWSLSRQARIALGPVLKHSSTDLAQSPFLATQTPYGSANFTQLGARVGAELDSRDVRANPTRGAHLVVGASIYPSLFDVVSTYGEVHGEAATYLTASLPLQPTLALRGGAKRVWGTYPFQDAAFVGGSNTVRGLRDHRFIGDASVYGNAELRLRLTRIRLVLPATVGISGLTDVGRVFFDDESSDTWHTAFGGGFWFAFLNPNNTFTVSFARGDGRTGVYLRGGFMY